MSRYDSAQKKSGMSLVMPFFDGGGQAPYIPLDLITGDGRA
jgi:hypothetical protein